jgi:hypothetical protein
MASKSKACLAVVVILIALCVWGRWLWHPSPHSENALRDTSGIEVTALKIERVEGGFRVACRIANHRRQIAEQVVFQVSLIGSNGEIVAVNPLAVAAAIPAGEIRELTVPVPASFEVSNVSARAQASLVRWRE